MNIEELHHKLRDIGISEDNYYLHGLFGSMYDDDKIALVIKQQNSRMEYEIYYRERGDKSVFITLYNEEEACDYILKDLLRSKAIKDSKRD